MKNRLVPMVEFVLEQFQLLYNAKITQDEYVSRTKKYADFLDKQLSIEMFIPCKLVDGVWVVLEEPKKVSLYDCTVGDHADMIQYKKAKERVLFEGFEAKKVEDYYIVQNKGIDVFCTWNKSKNIESLLWTNLELTSTAQKQIGL